MSSSLREWGARVRGAGKRAAVLGHRVHKQEGELCTAKFFLLAFPKNRAAQATGKKKKSPLKKEAVSTGNHDAAQLQLQDPEIPCTGAGGHACLTACATKYRCSNNSSSEVEI